MRRALLLVDLQQGFLDGVEPLQDLPGRIATYVRDRCSDYELVIATRFHNAPGSLYRRLIGDDMTSEREVALVPEIAELEDLHVVDKTTYSSITDEVLELLRAHDVDELHVAGVDTDECVLASVLAAFDHGIAPLVLEDLCGSCAGIDPHRSGLVALRRAIGEDRVVQSHERAVARNPTT